MGAARGARLGYLGREGHSSHQAQPCAAPASWRRPEIPLPVGTSLQEFPLGTRRWFLGFSSVSESRWVAKKAGCELGGSCSSSNPAGPSYIHGPCSGPWKYDSTQNKHRGTCCDYKQPEEPAASRTSNASVTSGCTRCAGVWLEAIVVSNAV